MGRLLYNLQVHKLQEKELLAMTVNKHSIRFQELARQMRNSNSDHQPITGSPWLLAGQDTPAARRKWARLTPEPWRICTRNL